MKNVNYPIVSNSKKNIFFISVVVAAIDLLVFLLLNHFADISRQLLVVMFLLVTLPQIAMVVFYLRLIHRPLCRQGNTMRLMNETGKNVMLLTPDTVPNELLPIDTELLNWFQSLIRHVIQLDSTEDLLKKQTELSILQSQINPHFLYNTLDSIRGQAIIDGADEVADAIEALSKFYRYGISIRGDLVTVEDEIKNVMNYIRIQQYRFDNKFKFNLIYEEADELSQYIMPKLTLQPLVENAIYHAFDQNESPGVITLKITVTQSRIILRVSDDGIGMDKETVCGMNECLVNRQKNPEVMLNRERTGGLGLQNINDRIKIFFGDNYGVTVYSAVGLGTDVEVVIPKRTQLDVDMEKWM